MTLVKTLRTAVVVATLGLAATTAVAEDVNIGFTGPLSGGAALYGENALSGLRMAADEINAAGGFDLGGETATIKLVSLDDRYSPSQAATNAKRLTQESGVPAIFVPHSGGTFALQDFNEKDGFLIMAYTSVPTVTEQGNGLTLRVPPTFDRYVQVFTEYAMANLGKNIALGGATHEYAKLWAEMLEQEWQSQGGRVLESNPMDYNKSADFYTGVSRLLAANPDMMFVGGASEPTGLVVQQARQMGYQGGFIVMDQAKLDEVAEVAGGLEMLEGAVGVTPLSAYGTEAANTFIRKYQDKYGKTPGSEAAYHYLALHALAHAMDLTDSTDPAVLRGAMAESLLTLDASKNPYGVQSVTDDGGFVTQTTLTVVENGELVRKYVN